MRPRRRRLVPDEGCADRDCLKDMALRMPVYDQLRVRFEKDREMYMKAFASPVYVLAGHSARARATARRGRSAFKRHRARAEVDDGVRRPCPARVER